MINGTFLFVIYLKKYALLFLNRELKYKKGKSRDKQLEEIVDDTPTLITGGTTNENNNLI